MNAHGAVPGLMIAAPRSGSGKTLLTLGLMRALRNKGLAVGAAKCGPDYIDPAFHAAATGRISVNLDSWAMAPELLRGLANMAAENGNGAADLVLCEGSMGLFDGVRGAPGRTGSSADVAAALGWPILLCVDVSGQAQSAAAIVKGCAVYDSRIRVAGAILNRVASERHRRLAADAIEALGVPVLGALPRDKKIELPERHLGLVQAQEIAGLETLLEEIAGFVAGNCALNEIVALARADGAGALTKIAALPPPAQRIAVARDAAFSFLYPHILEGWRALGAEIIFFSPLANEPPPPDSDLCWLPGGYPELHAGQLAAAEQFMAGLRGFAQTKPIHGECGGYMVLGEALIDAKGESHAMAGLLAPGFSFAKRSLHLGYREARLAASHPLGRAGARLRGHEFHYATMQTQAGEDPPFAHVIDAHGGSERGEGSRRAHVSGSFFHLIAAA
ncbi:cobyrinate a,c-diamide synthase [Methylocella silvestris]|uniref:Hydrogenobyrinate a,c-diamide synthase n=1 Tax=Methylocella silvestris TaxID=199596 RepID=A0A2J7TL36_METSI|nr:cobyrinate a,c-diamide synthase [Methylocella silvestris]PNG27478.1 cobyrinic acid a,c-diamide synthase [Methylocella silvestris]